MYSNTDDMSPLNVWEQDTWVYGIQAFDFKDTRKTDFSSSAESSEGDW